MNSVSEYMCALAEIIRHEQKSSIVSRTLLLLFLKSIFLNQQYPINKIILKEFFIQYICKNIAFFNICPQGDSNIIDYLDKYIQMTERTKVV